MWSRLTNLGSARLEPVLVILDKPSRFRPFELFFSPLDELSANNFYRHPGLPAPANSSPLGIPN
jgi:hypothetical protein